MATVYDVTDWKPRGKPLNVYEDIGAVINAMIADIKSAQTDQAAKPGAVIYIPPGDYSLKTRVVVDISNLKIRGSGHSGTTRMTRHRGTRSTRDPATYGSRTPTETARPSS